MFQSILVAALAASATAKPLLQKKQEQSIPQYVLDYAPLVYMHDTETHFPGDISAQLAHTKPEVNFAEVSGYPQPLTLDNLDSLNNLGGKDVYLTSVDDITTNPGWLNGVRPDDSRRTSGAVSSAILVVDKFGNGTVDAFYMYFYPYNEGNTVFGLEFGDHVGDWEHNMIRFENGEPTWVWYSQHANGAAYAYSAVEKDGTATKRVVAYSGNGTHATWATEGDHDHTIPDFVSPDGPLKDVTNKGALWDPTLSAYYYAVTFPNAPGDESSPSFTALADPTNGDAGAAPVAWLNFIGQWGDQQYPDDDDRQFDIFGQRKYTSGPTGPEDKQLNRANICPDNGNDCILRDALQEGS